MPGAPFLLAAALLGLGLVIAWRTLASKKRNPQREERAVRQSESIDGMAAHHSRSDGDGRDGA